MGEEINSFLTFARDKNIEVIDSRGIKIVNKDKFTNEDLYRHIDVICELHNRTTGFKDYLRGRIDNKIGKFTEENKVSLKRVSTFIKLLEQKSQHNKFENILLSNYQKYINMADTALKFVNDPSYIQFIIRCMEREEICLGRVWFNNLAMDNDKIYIRDIGSLSYNMIEMDCIEFLKRVRKKNKHLDVDYVSLCQYFCNKSNLDHNSMEFILNMVSFPSEFILCVNRYRIKKKNWSIETFYNRLEEAMEHENADIVEVRGNYDRKQI